jgi:ATP-dependent helicase/DNAse subunit B
MNYNLYDLIIAPNEVKKNILLNESQQLHFLKPKIITLQEFINNYFGLVSKKSLIYLMKEKHLSLNVSKVYLKNILFAPDLIDFKNDLEKNGYIIKNKYFLNNVNNILVINTYLIPKVIKDILNNYNVTYYEYKNKYIPNIFEFNTIDDEINYVASKISSFNLNNLNKCHLINVTDEYINSLERIFRLYNIPINLPQNICLNKTKVGIDFLNNIDLPIKDILSKLDKNDDYNTLIDLLNEYEITNLDDINKIVIKDLLKNTIIKEQKIDNAVSCINISELFNQDDYYFYLGFNDGIVPIIKKDEDFLSDKEKKQIGLLTSNEENKLEKEYISKIIFSLPNLIITYKLKVNKEIFLPSNLIVQNNLKTIKNASIENTYSNKINTLNMAIKIDKYYKYEQIDNDLKDYLKTYDEDQYSSYDNSFSKLSHMVEDYLKTHLVLSYSSLSEYYKCNFAFYLDKVLKVNKFEDTFAIFIGNLFHHILSKLYEKDFDFETSYNEYLPNRSLTKEEEYLLINIKKEILFVINYIKIQDQNTNYTNAFTEKKVYIDKDKYGLPFLGFIDKIKYEKVDDHYNIVIVDYKTGQDKPHLDNLEDGFNLQLPIYTVLVKEILPNSFITGIYLQRILTKRKLKETDKDHEKNLKLDGYTINNENKISSFDYDYKTSSFINNMSLNKDGSISKKAKLLTEEDFKNISLIVEKDIKNATQNILNAHFEINPKRINEENKSCTYCPFKDICYKKEEDIIDLEYKPFKDNEVGEENELN